MVDSSDESTANVEVLVTAGELAFGAGELKKAESFFKEALALDPLHVVAMNNLGVLNHHKGDLAEAEIRLLRAALFSEKPGDVLVNLAAAAQAQAQLTAATEYLRIAIRSAGETPRILEQMASLAEVMGDATNAAVLRAKSAALSADAEQKGEAQ